jgi:hypothetical protein
MQQTILTLRKEEKIKKTAVDIAQFVKKILVTSECQIFVPSSTLQFLNTTAIECQIRALFGRIHTNEQSFSLEKRNELRMFRSTYNHEKCNLHKHKVLPTHDINKIWKSKYENLPRNF